MDPELRAYLDSMRAEMVAIERSAISRDAATRETLEAKIDKTREEVAVIRGEAAATRPTLRTLGVGGVGFSPF